MSNNNEVLSTKTANLITSLTRQVYNLTAEIAELKNPKSVKYKGVTIRKEVMIEYTFQSSAISENVTHTTLYDCEHQIDEELGVK